MSYEEVADTFRECAAFRRWPFEEAERVIQMVGRLEDVADVRTPTALLAD
jgi:hypothetical protein